jgi:hypothetical protein
MVYWNMIEYITHAAIYYQGKVYLGSRHCYIGHAMVKSGCCPRPFPGGEAQGFVTNTGRLVGRKEAAQIAIAAGQISKLPYGEKLFSEWVLINDEREANSNYPCGEVAGRDYGCVDCPNHERAKRIQFEFPAGSQITA